MTKYNKLWGGIGGYALGILFTVFMMQGWATCATPDVVDTCTILGMDMTAVNRVVEGIFGLIGVWAAPKNAE